MLLAFGNTLYTYTPIKMILWMVIGDSTGYVFIVWKYLVQDVYCSNGGLLVYES